jgi:hypothetical protein
VVVLAVERGDEGIALGRVLPGRVGLAVKEQTAIAGIFGIDIDLPGPSWMRRSTARPLASATAAINWPSSAPSVSIFEATTIAAPGGASAARAISDSAASSRAAATRAWAKRDLVGIAASVLRDRAAAVDAVGRVERSDTRRSM